MPNFSIFETMMLVCFGAAWPVSIFKSLTSKKTAGKSLWFMIIIFIGYLGGITHKLLYSNDLVMYLYFFNAIMVFVDILLYFRNKSTEKKLLN